jgi:hypothetical protein
MPLQNSWDYYLDYRQAFYFKKEKRQAFDDQSTSSEWINLDNMNIESYT